MSGSLHFSFILSFGQPRSGGDLSGPGLLSVSHWFLRQQTPPLSNLRANQPSTTTLLIYEKMARMTYVSKAKEIFIIMCIFQISNSLPVSDTFQNNEIRIKRDVNLIQDKLIQTLNPQPILDTITEAEKCCNLQQHPIGKKLLSVIEQVTSVAANAIQVPAQKVNALSASVTDYLNQIGAKLVGLQK